MTCAYPHCTLPEEHDGGHTPAPADPRKAAVAADLDRLIGERMAPTAARQLGIEWPGI